MDIVDVIYQKSESFHCQGTLVAVLKRYRPDGFYIKERGGGRGNWTAYRYAKIILILEEDGERIEQDVSKSVKALYHRSKLTQKLSRDLLSDLKSGKVSLEDL